MTLNQCSYSPRPPQGLELLGFYFQGSYYIDRALPMDCSISCTAFESLSSFLEWKLRCSVGCKNTVHCSDDYLFCGESNTGKCKFTLKAFQTMAQELGLPLAEEKTEGPATSLTFLGIELDTRQHASRLPDTKLDALKAQINLLMRSRKV